MIKKPLPFKGLNIRIRIIIPIKGRGFINHGSGLGVNRGVIGILENRMETTIVYWCFIGVMRLVGPKSLGFEFGIRVVQRPFGFRV